MERVIDDQGIIFMANGQEVARMAESVEDNVAVIAMSGSFTSELKDDFYDEAVALITVGNGIELNMKNVTHLSPSVSLAFLSLEDKLESLGKSLRMTHVPDVIFQHFRSRGMHELFDIELEK